MRQEIDFHGVHLVLLSSITEVSACDRDAVVVSGSHGGASVVDYALRYPLRGVFFNDAGVGKDLAGIVSLAVLERHGLAAGAVAHISARIGDAEDGFLCGWLSHVNGPAHACGMRERDLLRDAIPRCFGRTG
ncbi:MULTISPECIES: hypothetical protein [unclassified Sphingomonas]|uniref:hypothetical protein n=1 Tax=unclassified Sphingomonas TaxID=196159 RepID=UPI0006F3066E|nr:MULTISPECIES: hypothetical protein [unclassified Sphingomonas]KQX19242.1 hypothetical protein ASD17_11860 [Sphingomonas sp. Root1294]KQY65444.1 hypothetical protein ASD39_15060 [Sphingomonas sp. Root50]KRB95258.1 hypothetical protein ASE22_04995 [Sphingomonas sp. Root720]